MQRLAQALTPVIPSDDLIAILNQYQEALVQTYLLLMRAKLGLTTLDKSTAEQDKQDLELIGQFTVLMEKNQLDYAQTWRQFGQLDPRSQHSSLRDDFIDTHQFDTWYKAYQLRLGDVTDIAAWQTERNSVNPKYILRNYLAQEAIIAVEEGNLAPLQRLQQVLSQPFAEQVEHDELAKRPPDWGQGLIMSCSS
ncbi:hypothetical protein SPWS13_3180 [Shewanella putrefaciens]|nr:hypothetical protein SPWS13_3180 [Shewanella putrefaciens]